jgi:PRTRC genetic system protein B
MSPIHPFHDEDLQAEAALYFLPQGHYLFRWREETGLCGSKFVTADDLQAAFTDSERDTGWLAPGIVRAGYGKHGEWFVLHAPPQRIDIHILEMGTVSIPLPDLVLAGAGRSYYLWALQEPFSPLARLFDAPFPNIHNGGQICWGNNTPPAAHPANARTVWRLFFESPFNSHLNQGKTRRHAQDVRKFLVELNGRRKFPSGQLCAERGTLSAAIERLFK